MKAVKGKRATICFGETDAGERIRGLLDRGDLDSIVVDLSTANRLDPAGLEALEHAGQAARAAGIPVFLAGVTPEVYKALHIAKLTGLFVRTNAPEL